MYFFRGILPLLQSTLKGRRPLRFRGGLCPPFPRLNSPLFPSAFRRPLGCRSTFGGREGQKACEHLVLFLPFFHVRGVPAIVFVLVLVGPKKIPKRVLPLLSVVFSAAVLMELPMLFLLRQGKPSQVNCRSLPPFPMFPPPPPNYQAVPQEVQPPRRIQVPFSVYSPSQAVEETLPKNWLG